MVRRLEGPCSVSPLSQATDAGLLLPGTSTFIILLAILLDLISSLLAECIDQVGQGKIKWKDCPEQALLRDEVMAAWPKDAAGWPKKMSARDEAHYVARLSERERHCVVGLGGSQKAEVAWLDAQGIPYEELDVDQFILEYLTGFQGGSPVANPMSVYLVRIHAP